MPRKSHYGDGSVYQRKDGRWEAIIFHEGRKISVYGKTEIEARKKMRERQRQVLAGEIARDPTRQTVGDYLLQWLDSCKVGIRPHTTKNYQSHIQHVLNHPIAKIQLQKLTREHIQSFYNTLNLAPSSMRTLHTTYKKAFQDAVEAEKLVKNPCHKVKLPQPQDGEMHEPPPENIVVIIQDILDIAQAEFEQEQSRISLIVLFAIATGMRIGELAALRWEHLDLEKSLVAVRGTLIEIEEIKIGPPKTKSSKRNIVLADFAVEALRAYRVKQLKQKLQTKNWEQLNLVFANRKGGFLQTSLIRRQFKAFLNQHGILEKYRLRKFKFHWLRHGTASILFAMGIPIEVIGQMLGHTRASSITANIYTHIDQQLHIQAASAMNKLVQHQ